MSKRYSQILILFGIALFLGVQITWSRKIKSMPEIPKLYISERQSFDREMERIKKVSPSYKLLSTTLEDSRKVVLRGDWGKFYSFRTADYIATVPKKVYLTTNSKTPAPLDSFFTLRNSSIGLDSASISVTYLISDRVFIKTTDLWTFDKASTTWKFIGNTLPWGSPIVSPKS